MSYEAKPFRPGHALLLILAALLLGACGQQGDPQPPLRDVPIRTTDLAVRQQGPALLFDLGYPSTTVSGTALGGIEALELLTLERQPNEDGGLPTVQPNEFDLGAKVVLTLRGADLNAATSGSRVQLQIPLEDPLPDPAQAYFFAVRTQKGEEQSAISNLAGLIPVAPPAAPQQLRLEAQADGVKLAWRYPGSDVQGFDVYRRDARVRGYGKPVAKVPGEGRDYLDRSARYGERYIYTVRATTDDEPPIESAAAGEAEIQFEDRFAPPLPRNVVALAERNSVRLRWDKSAADDVAGYFLYRREPGREFHRLNEKPLDALEYLDRGLVTGLSYDYRIQVVDESGNESPVSASVSTTVR